MSNFPQKVNRATGGLALPTTGLKEQNVLILRKRDQAALRNFSR